MVFTAAWLSGWQVGDCCRPLAVFRVGGSARRTHSVGRHSSNGRGEGRTQRLAGRLHASLDYGQVDEILNDDPCAYLAGIGRQCAQIHAVLYQSYVAYPIELAIPDLADKLRAPQSGAPLRARMAGPDATPSRQSPWNGHTPSNPVSRGWRRGWT